MKPTKVYFLNFMENPIEVKCEKCKKMLIKFPPENSSQNPTETNCKFCGQEHLIAYGDSI